MLHTNARPSDRHRPRGARGFGLAESLVALSLLSLLLASGLRGGTALRDRWATAGARDALVALVHEARSRAVERGGAVVVLDASTHVARLESGGDSVRQLRLASEFGVQLDLGARDEVRLVFDAAGVGRMASRSLHLTRGASSARLVVSTYGRVR
ncbi:GspH/FimT family pseudopilin [Gaopeijia maritima]|uniref:GspH/FimT family pseudopilin n=1 Tax=Gaopeijia maritima TaxID=3119007 RepID=UPI00324FC8AC